MAVDATERALTDAGLLGQPLLQSGAVGVSYGSSFSTPMAVQGFAELQAQGSSRARALCKNVDASTLDRVLARLPEGAADFWKLD